jgi:uncharacterized DUF497 family protein
MDFEWDVEFEWDATKAEANLRRHGVSFEAARAVFNDPLSITYSDPGHSETEDRYITMGISETGQILLVVHTDRQRRIRIISARTVTGKERRTYEEGI